MVYRDAALLCLCTYRGATEVCEPKRGNPGRQGGREGGALTGLDGSDTTVIRPAPRDEDVLRGRRHVDLGTAARPFPGPVVVVDPGERDDVGIRSRINNNRLNASTRRGAYDYPSPHGLLNRGAK